MGTAQRRPIRGTLKGVRRFAKMSLYEEEVGIWRWLSSYNPSMRCAFNSECYYGRPFLESIVSVSTTHQEVEHGIQSEIRQARSPLTNAGLSLYLGRGTGLTSDSNCDNSRESFDSIFRVLVTHFRKPSSWLDWNERLGGGSEEMGWTPRC